MSCPMRTSVLVLGPGEREEIIQYVAKSNADAEAQRNT